MHGSILAYMALAIGCYYISIWQSLSRPQLWSHQVIMIFILILSLAAVAASLNPPVVAVVTGGTRGAFTSPPSNRSDLTPSLSYRARARNRPAASRRRVVPSPNLQSEQDRRRVRGRVNRAGVPQSPGRARGR